MIYFTAVTDIKAGSSFDATMRRRNPVIPLPTWGITELSQTTFKRIKRNDYVLFYNKGNIIGVGHVSSTAIDKEFSAKLWGTYQHRFKGTLHWSGIIQFDRYHDMAMPFNLIRNLGGYDTKFSIRRMVQLNTAGVVAIESIYGGEEAYVTNLIKTYGNLRQAQVSVVE